MKNTKATAVMWREVGKTTRVAISSWGHFLRLCLLILVLVCAVVACHYLGVIL